MIDRGIAEGMKMHSLPDSTTLQAHLDPFADFELIILILSGVALVVALILIIKLLRSKDKDK